MAADTESELRKLKTRLAITENDKQLLEQQVATVTRKFDNHRAIYAKLQERFRQLQDNIDTITEAPLREAEERAKTERARMQSQQSALQLELTHTRSELQAARDRVRQLEQVIQDKDEEAARNPSSVAALTKRIESVQEAAAEATASAFRSQRNLSVAERRAQVAQRECEAATAKVASLESELADRIATDRAREAARRADRDRDALEKETLREEVEALTAKLTDKKEELGAVAARNRELRDRLQSCGHEIRALTDKLACKGQQLDRSKEALVAAKEAFQRMSKNLRAAKEREAEVLRRQEKADAVLTEYRRLRETTREVKARLAVSATDIATLERTNHLAVAAKNQAKGAKRDAETRLRAAQARAAYADKKAALEVAARLRVEHECKELRAEVMALHRHVKSMTDAGMRAPADTVRPSTAPRNRLSNTAVPAVGAAGRGLLRTRSAGTKRRGRRRVATVPRRRGGGADGDKDVVEEDGGSVPASPITTPRS